MTTATLIEKKKLDRPPLDIHYLGDRVLRQPAKRVAKVDDKLRQTIKEMLQTMYSSDGIGLTRIELFCQQLRETSLLRK